MRQQGITSEWALSRTGPRPQPEGPLHRAYEFAAGAGRMQSRDSDDTLSQSPRPQLLNLNRLHDLNLVTCATSQVSLAVD